jgi:hypothetical protein
MTDAGSPLADRAKKAVEDAFDETVKGRVEAMLNNLAGGTSLPEAAGMMKKGLLQVKAGRDAAIKIMAEVFGP